MESRKKLEEQLIKKAVEDPSFRQSLLKNPHAIIQEECTESVPQDITIHVVEETSRDMYLVLPPANSRELSDNELECITGGGSGQSWSW